MPASSSFHSQQPLLVNTIGHAGGALVFALSLYFLLAASTRGRRPASRLSLAAASLAFLWNFASLIALASREFAWPGTELAVAVSTSALSLLPAVLLHLALGPRFGWIVKVGYALGGAAVLMHGAENFVPGLSHQSALFFTTCGFGALTLAATMALLKQGAAERETTSRLVGAMALFLFAVSVAHVGAEEHSGGAIEMVAHHGGVVLALIVLLQDYRFVLLDSFLRVLANLVLAGGFILLVSPWAAPALTAATTPFLRGVAFVALVLLLWLYSELRQRLQSLLTSMVFGRRERERLTAEADNEAGYLVAAELELASFLRAELRNPSSAAGLTEGLALTAPATVSELPPARREKLEAAGVEAVVPVRLPAGETHYLLLGYRAGGRRYLSEDLRACERLAAQISERVATFRSAEMRRLVTQAELRALESQIQPHFLFNVLNTLYGLIPRQAEAARATVLNLADLLRYHLKQDRTFIALDEELRTVEAYLAIERLRLGDRLRVRLEVDPEARSAQIPVLSLEPLVENAVKHAVAARPEGGEVAVLAIRLPGGGVRVRVEDTGPGFSQPARQGGVGLANVRRRLQLCYGAAEGQLNIESTTVGSAVEFTIPPPEKTATGAAAAPASAA